MRVRGVRSLETRVRKQKRLEVHGRRTTATVAMAIFLALGSCDAGGEGQVAAEASCEPLAQVTCACPGGGAGISWCPESGALTGPCEGCGDDGVPTDGTRSDDHTATNDPPDAHPYLSQVEFDLMEGTTFPTYVAHLYGKDVGGEPTYFAQATITNPGPSSASLALEVMLQGYSTPKLDIVDVPAGSTVTVPVNVTFDFDSLYGLSAPIQAAATARLSWTSTDDLLDTVSVATTVAPKNTVFWAIEGEDGNLASLYPLVAVLVTPHDAAGEVDALLTDAAGHSSFGQMYGYGTFDPSKTIPWSATVTAGDCQSTGAWYLAGQTVQVAIDVTCSLCFSYNAYYVVTDPAGDEVLRQDGLGEGYGTFVAKSDGLYTHHACNPPSNSSNRIFGVARSMGVNDASYDQLAAIYSALAARGTVYTNVPSSYFESSQNVKSPAESLASGSQNCIDGSLVVASALEALGMQPAIAIVPGHAFVAVRMYDDPSSPWLPIETTMVATQPAGIAYSTALDEWNAAAAAGNLDLLDIKALREAGVLPAPM